MLAETFLKTTLFTWGLVWSDLGHADTGACLNVLLFDLLPPPAEKVQRTVPAVIKSVCDFQVMQD